MSPPDVAALEPFTTCLVTQGIMSKKKGKISDVCLEENFLHLLQALYSTRESCPGLYPRNQGSAVLYQPVVFSMHPSPPSPCPFRGFN